MKIEEFVIHTTVFRIYCNGCAKVVTSESDEVVVAQAREKGYTVTGNNIYCGECKKFYD